MSVSDMEPWAVKTLLLLNSKADDSAEQLRLMLEESIRQKYGGRKLLRPIPGYVKKQPLSHHGNSEVDDTISKKSKGDSKKLNMSPEFIRCSSLSSGSDSSTDDSDDIGMEILEEDLACIVCREIASGPRNRLIECSECHCLYHQECHTPNITDMDVSDPRHVWYCVNCSRSVTKPKSSSNSGMSSSKSNYKSVSSTPRTSQGSPVMPLVKPFGGLPMPSKKPSSSSKSSSSSSKSVNPNISNIISADRRLQIMKKRAARKLEKRIHSK